jgi:hypothetical protein
MAISTLPNVSLALGVSLDALRELVRGDPQLRALGVKVGPATGYTPAEVETIQAAWEAKRAQKAAKRKEAGA